MKQLIPIDYAIIAVYIIASFAIGNYYMRRAGSSLDEYFLPGRSTPWWLIGVSMAATNYSIDYSPGHHQAGGQERHHGHLVCVVAGHRGHCHHVLLLPALAAGPGGDRRRADQVPLQRQARRRPAHLQRRLFRRHHQLLRPGLGFPGADEGHDRDDPVEPVADPHCLRRGDHDLHHDAAGSRRSS